MDDNQTLFDGLAADLVTRIFFLAILVLWRSISSLLVVMASSFVLRFWHSGPFSILRSVSMMLLRRGCQSRGQSPPKPVKHVSKCVGIGPGDEATDLLIFDPGFVNSIEKCPGTCRVVAAKANR